MDFARRLCNRFFAFCLNVVRLRSAFTIPYIMLLNFTFCALVFYADVQTQIRSLYGLAVCVLLGDVLFSPTRNHSVLFAIVMWPIRDFFKTLCVCACFLAAYELRQQQTSEAFVSALAAVMSLVVNPVYKHNNINAKILALFGQLLNLLNIYFLQPFLAIFEWTKYIVLFRWFPVVLRYLREHLVAGIGWLSRSYWQPLRSALSQLAAAARYWLCFHWCADLTRWAQRKIFLPLASKLARTLDAFVYVVGCYWLVPAMKAFVRRMRAGAIWCLGQCWSVCILFGVYVAQPLLLAAMGQVRLVLVFCYFIAVKPLVDACYSKYKHVEDWAFIFVLGPFFKKIVDCIPERNPFAIESSDAELLEFLPKSMSTEDNTESGCETDGSVPSHRFSSDECEFMPRGLKRVDISCSDSSDAEFSLLPTRQRKSRRLAKN